MQCSKHKCTRQWLSTLKSKSYSLIIGSGTIEMLGKGYCEINSNFLRWWRYLMKRVNKLVNHVNINRLKFATAVVYFMNLHLSFFISFDTILVWWNCSVIRILSFDYLQMYIKHLTKLYMFFVKLTWSQCNWYFAISISKNFKFFLSEIQI